MASSDDEELEEAAAFDVGAITTCVRNIFHDFMRCTCPRCFKVFGAEYILNAHQSGCTGPTIEGDAELEICNEGAVSDATAAPPDLATAELQHNDEATSADGPACCFSDKEGDALLTIALVHVSLERKNSLTCADSTA